MIKFSDYDSLRVAAVVTLYNSQPDCVKHISTYQNQVDWIYLIDNSETPNYTLIAQLVTWNNIQYINNQGNKGVATSLNTGAQLAISDGFDLLLTMDDDTTLPPNALDVMLTYLSDITSQHRVGIISGIHTPNDSEVKVRSVRYTMTSGNLLNLEAYRRVGPFRDDFFIDHIDHEYCLRLNRAGYKVLELPSIQLTHHLGEQKPSGWGKRDFISHSPIRGYYLVRNGLTVAKLFPSFRLFTIKFTVVQVLKILLFEDEKLYRFKLIWNGLLDGFLGKMGKYKK